MGTTSSSEVEAERILRSLKPATRTEAEKGFKRIARGAPAFSYEDFEKSLVSIHDLSGALPRDVIRKLFRHAYGSEDAVVGWPEYVKALARYEGKGPKRAIYDALTEQPEEKDKVVLKILGCFAPGGQGDDAGRRDLLDSLEHTIDVILSGGKVYMTDRQTDSSSVLEQSLSFDAFVKITRVVPSALDCLSAVCDPVPRALPKPALRYSLDRERSLLTPPRAFFLSKVLGTGSTWVQVFHSDKLGKAWPSMLKQVEERQRTLILIKTKEGAVVGGLGGATWYKAAKFFGEEDGGGGSSVFSLHPVARVYNCTGFNNNFQYLASGKEAFFTLCYPGVSREHVLTDDCFFRPCASGCVSGINPNGLGFGGQVKNFALFLDSNLDVGHSYPSATFNNLPLHHCTSEGGKFAVDQVEVWAPQDVLDQEKEESEGNPSKGVLHNEKFKADQMILGFAGKYQAHHEQA
uniref:Oxidation resistance protein 1 n=1 Tax=Chloropicon primus TaxID=1764295 RepID=A0A7S2X0M2_9CHLO|mmetsp:Transcript_6829/g.19954  ORF Transcript_6829/g.19954 Transcript_6829/m.19954 type:complete len:462 (+) Transcript_6829:238-1623(+)